MNEVLYSSKASCSLSGTYIYIYHVPQLRTRICVEKCMYVSIHRMWYIAWYIQAGSRVASQLEQPRTKRVAYHVSEGGKASFLPALAQCVLLGLSSTPATAASQLHYIAPCHFILPLLIKKEVRGKKPVLKLTIFCMRGTQVKIYHFYFLISF